MEEYNRLLHEVESRNGEAVKRITDYLYRNGKSLLSILTIAQVIYLHDKAGEILFAKHVNNAANGYRITYPDDDAFYESLRAVLGN
jgi:uncharacterized protein with ATP-grasp and redox domains